MGLGTTLARVTATAVLLGTLLVPGTAGRAARAFAVCDEEPPDATDLITIVAPVPTQAGYGGVAPVALVIHIAEGLAVFPAASLTSELRWGDGTTSVVVSLPCPDGESAYWPDQDLTHTYTVPGTYTVTWHFSFAGQVYDIPFVQMAVVAPQAQPTPSPTPPPAATSTTPVPTNGGPAGPTAPASSTSLPGSPTATRTAPSTRTQTATPTVTAAGPAPTELPGTPSSGGSATAPTPVPNEDYRPQNFLPIEPVTDVSGDPEVIATNLVIAGVTVWVLFTSVLLNQVLQENRATIDQRTARVMQPLRRIRRPAGSSAPRLPLWARRLAGPSVALLLTGVIYSTLEPGFGLNSQTLVLFGSAVVGVGLVTYLSAGIESISLRRLSGARAAIRPYPAGIGIAVASVAISRLLDLQPGVMFGFIASCTVAGGVSLGRRESGRVALAPVGVALAVAIVAWLAVGPVRELNESRSGWFPALLEASVIVMFIGGIEGVVISMVPIAETDGGKIYRWNRWLWGAVALTAAFLTWHVLLGRERTYFTGLREAASVTVLLVFLVSTALTVALWVYFRLRGREHTPPAPEPEPTPGPSTAG